MREEDPSPELSQLLLTLGPQYSEVAAAALNWTREKIMKWTGMGASEFADLVGLPEVLKGITLGRLTDAKELLKEAAILGHEETVITLLEKMSKVKDEHDVKQDIIEAFHYGCFYGNEWVVRNCLAYVPVDAADIDGQTGLHKAARQGYSWVAAALLEFGADLDKRDKWGNTPLDDAIYRDYPETIRLFMTHRGALVASSRPTVEVPLTGISSLKDRKVGKHIGMNATIVDFYIETNMEGDTVEEHRLEQKPVEALIWDEEIGSDASDDMTSGEASPDPDFKWIHLPANNVRNRPAYIYRAQLT